MKLDTIGSVELTDKGDRHFIYEAPIAWTPSGNRQLSKVADHVAGVKDVLATPRDGFVSVVVIDIAGSLPSGTTMKATADMFWRKLDSEMSTWTTEERDQYLLGEHNDTARMERRDNQALYG